MPYHALIAPAAHCTRRAGAADPAQQHQALWHAWLPLISSLVADAPFAGPLAGVSLEAGGTPAPRHRRCNGGASSMPVSRCWSSRQLRHPLGLLGGRWALAGSQFAGTVGPPGHCYSPGGLSWCCARHGQGFAMPGPTTPTFIRWRSSRWRQRRPMPCSTISCSPMGLRQLYRPGSTAHRGQSILCGRTRTDDAGAGLLTVQGERL